MVEADTIALGEALEYYRWNFDHPSPDDPFWQSTNVGASLAEVSAPAHLIGGWHDLFLRETLDDYARLRDAGRRPHLTIGPWHHSQLAVPFESVREGLAWFDVHLKGDRSRLREMPVRIYVTGAGHWREMEDWPPPTCEARYALGSGGWLADAAIDRRWGPRPVGRGRHA